MLRHEIAPAELIGRSIVVEVPSVGDLHKGIRTEGEIKDAHAVQPGWLRVGVEFSNPETARRAIVTLLGVLDEINESGSTMLLARMSRRA